MRRLLLLVGAIVLVDTMFFAALTPLLPHYVDELDLGKAGAGVLQSMYPIGALLAGMAELLVSGDGDLLALRDRYAIETPAEFARRL